jgi:hypothetical protein
MGERRFIAHKNSKYEGDPQILIGQLTLSQTGSSRALLRENNIMSHFDNSWRLGTAFALSVASVGGAAASSQAFGTQTHAVQLCFPGSVSSTGGCRIAIVSPNDALLPANWIEVFRCSPGQRVSAISNDAGTFSLSITELTD